MKKYMVVEDFIGGDHKTHKNGEILIANEGKLYDKNNTLVCSIGSYHETDKCKKLNDTKLVKKEGQRFNKTEVLNVKVGDIVIFNGEDEKFIINQIFTWCEIRTVDFRGNFKTWRDKDIKLMKDMDGSPIIEERIEFNLDYWKVGDYVNSEGLKILYANSNIIKMDCLSTCPAYLKATTSLSLLENYYAYEEVEEIEYNDSDLPIICEYDKEKRIINKALDGNYIVYNLDGGYCSQLEDLNILLLCYKNIIKLGGK